MIVYHCLIIKILQPQHYMIFFDMYTPAYLSSQQIQNVEQIIAKNKKRKLIIKKGDMLYNYVLDKRFEITIIAISNNYCKFYFNDDVDLVFSKKLNKLQNWKLL